MMQLPRTLSDEMRWRLILGKEEDQEGEQGCECAGGEGSDQGGHPGAGGQPRPGSGDTPKPGQGDHSRGLSWADRVDRSLDFLYGCAGRKSSARGYGGGAGLGESQPYLPEWLDDIRSCFPKEVVTLIQKDAIERRGLKQLLFEPETLQGLEKNIDLAITLLDLKDLIPDRAREVARQIVKEVVDELRRKLEEELKKGFSAQPSRIRHVRQGAMRAVDWKRTIKANLDNWLPEANTIIPEKVYYWETVRRMIRQWDLIVVVDQSGSMGESVIYASLISAVFATLYQVYTRVLFFDTAVVDMTPYLADPVDLLFSAQLGGGTDIAHAVARGDELIRKPEKTIFLLVTDLEEGGDQSELVARVRQMVESRVRVLCALAINDRSSEPSYNTELAKEFADLGVRPFACTPKKLVEIMAALVMA